MSGRSGTVLTIGGVRFTARHDRSIRLTSPSPAYAPFIDSPSLDAKSIEIDVEIELDDPVEPKGRDLLFDAGSWRVYSLGESDSNLLFVWRPTGGTGPLWTARLRIADEDMALEVTCDPGLVQADYTLTNPLTYPLDQLLIDLVLATRRGTVIHAAGLRRGAWGTLFAGPSGAGKTTLMRGIDDPSIDRLSDDRLVLRGIDDEIRVYGTPWTGEGNVASPGSARLASMVFLRQSESERLERIDPPRAIRRLLPVLSVLWFDRRRADATLAFCEELALAVPAYELHFPRRGIGPEILDRLLTPP